MSAQVRQNGNLEISQHANGRVEVRLVRCPFCLHEFEEKERRHLHFYKEHGPADLGLSPLSADHAGPSSLESFGGDGE